MTDADLIYNALLRAEKRMEADIKACDPGEPDYRPALAVLRGISLIRDEIGNGLSGERR